MQDFRKIRQPREINNLFTLEPTREHYLQIQSPEFSLDFDFLNFLPCYNVLHLQAFVVSTQLSILGTYLNACIDYFTYISH